MDSFNIDDDSNDNEEYDEFLFDSIKRYNTLQMFNLENIPSHIFQLDESSICVVSKRNKGNNSEFLKLKVPGKLILPPLEESLCKENDFKVLSGLYTENIVYKVSRLFDSEQVIASQIDISGLNIYTLQHNSLGTIKQEHKLDAVPWKSSEFVVNEVSVNVICSKCYHEPLLQVDVNTNKKIKEIKHPFHTLNITPADWSEKKEDPCFGNNIKCQVLSSDVISILNTHSGDLVLHDLRTNNIFAGLPGVKKKSGDEEWTVTDYDSKISFLTYFGMLSNKKRFYIYDVRTNSMVVQNEGSEHAENVKNLKMKFCKNGDRFSISGMNSVVDIFQMDGNNYKHIFTHNGHCPGKSSSYFVTDHIWLETGGKEFVVSVCDNRTLNCWDYNATC